MHLKINVQRVITTIFKLNDNGHFLRFGQLKKLIYIAGMDRLNRRKLKMSWYMYDEFVYHEVIRDEDIETRSLKF